MFLTEKDTGYKLCVAVKCWKTNKIPTGLEIRARFRGQSVNPTGYESCDIGEIVQLVAEKCGDFPLEMEFGYISNALVRCANLEEWEDKVVWVGGGRYTSDISKADVAIIVSLEDQQ
jgi:hypothetical protein